ncbi:unnamed protein product [Calypogeia fissa]
MVDTFEYWNADVLKDGQGQQRRTANAHSIFKCPDHMREANKGCYDPRALTLGPYAPKRGSKYASLNTQKLNVARNVMTSKGVSSIEQLATALEITSDEIHRKFVSIPNWDIEAVRRILAIDSLFVVGIFVAIFVESNNYPAFDPQSVLNEEGFQTFFFSRNVILTMGFSVKMKRSYILDLQEINLSSCEHLLHFYYRVTTGNRSDEGRFSPDKLGVLDIRLSSISELQLFGLQLKSEPKYLSSVRFRKGTISTIYLPQIIINNDTETLIRNLVAFEFPTERPPVVSSYVVLMDHLIDTVSDVQTMRKHRVFECDLGDDKLVCKLWNGFRHDDLLISKDRLEEFERIMDARSRFMKQLWDTYRQAFASLYIILGLVAAVILLVCAIVQTLYSALSYYHTF